MGPAMPKRLLASYVIIFRPPVATAGLLRLARRVHTTLGLRRSLRISRWPDFTAGDLALLLALCGAQFADVATTNLGLNRGAWEINPLMDVVQTHLGATWWVPKCALVVLSGITVLTTRAPRLPIVMTVAVTWLPAALNLLEL